MCMGMNSGVFVLVHALILLTVSFFVLSAALKSDSQGLKTFGVIIAVLLWIAAALVLGKAVISRQCKMNKMNMMGQKMCGSMMDKGMMEHKMDNPAPAK